EDALGRQRALGERLCGGLDAGGEVGLEVAGFRLVDGAAGAPSIEGGRLDLARAAVAHDHGDGLLGEAVGEYAPRVLARVLEDASPSPPHRKRGVEDDRNGRGALGRGGGRGGRSELRTGDRKGDE